MHPARDTGPPSGLGSFRSQFALRAPGVERKTQRPRRTTARKFPDSPSPFRVFSLGLTSNQAAHPLRIPTVEDLMNPAILFLVCAPRKTMNCNERYGCPSPSPIVGRGIAGGRRKRQM